MAESLTQLFITSPQIVRVDPSITPNSQRFSMGSTLSYSTTPNSPRSLYDFMGSLNECLEEPVQERLPAHSDPLSHSPIPVSSRDLVPTPRISYFNAPSDDQKDIDVVLGIGETPFLSGLRFPEMTRTVMTLMFCMTGCLQSTTITRATGEAFSY